MSVRGSLASLAMATTGCPVGQLKDANGECRWVYVPEQQQQQQQQQDAPIQGNKGGLLDDWIRHESPPTDDYGKYSRPFFPIDDPEPLVLFQRSTGDRWVWDYGTESHYNKLFSESIPGLVGAPGEQLVDIGPPNSTILSAMGGK